MELCLGMKGLRRQFLRAGFNAADLSRVIAYLQKEIRAARRNIGELKLSNLLQLDRFEEVTISCRSETVSGGIRTIR